MKLYDDSYDVGCSGGEADINQIICLHHTLASPTLNAKVRPHKQARKLQATLVRNYHSLADGGEV